MAAEVANTVAPSFQHFPHPWAFLAYILLLAYAAASVVVLLYRDRVSGMVMLISCFWIAGFMITTVVVRIEWSWIAVFMVTTRSATVGVNITPLERERTGTGAAPNYTDLEMLTLKTYGEVDSFREVLFCQCVLHLKTSHVVMLLCGWNMRCLLL